MAEAGGSTNADCTEGRGEDAEHNNSIQFICLLVSADVTTRKPVTRLSWVKETKQQQNMCKQSKKRDSLCNNKIVLIMMMMVIIIIIIIQ
jgi:hypothetical protein